jgi:hypothetical protein
VSVAQSTQRPVSHWYIEGIKEGRACLEKYGSAFAADELSNLKSTIKGFGADTAVGQMLRGERDFWAHQISLAKATGSAS